MASILKPGIMRQSLFSATSKHLLSTQAPVARAMRSSTFGRPSSNLFTRSHSALDGSRNTILASRVASFHTSSKREILPPGPQVVNGTMNDPAPVPKPSPTHGSYHWTFERAVCVGILPLTVAPFAAGSLSPVMDAIFVSTILIHSHIGFQACVTDYFPNWQHPTLRRFMGWLLNLSTVVVGIGFYEFETNDVGITEALKRIWKA